MICIRSAPQWTSSRLSKGSESGSREQQARELVGGRDQPFGTGVFEFFAGAVSVECADRCDLVVMCADDVVSSITDHGRPHRIDPGSVEDMAEKFGLVCSRSVELGSKDLVKELDEFEMFEDLTDEDLWLARCDGESCSAFPKLAEQIMDSGVGRVFVETDGCEALAVEADGLGRSIGVEELLEILEQRRSDAPGELVGRRAIYSELLEGVLDRARDADFGVGQRSVEIEEHILAGGFGFGHAGFLARFPGRLTSTGSSPNRRPDNPESMKGG